MCELLSHSWLKKHASSAAPLSTPQLTLCATTGSAPKRASNETVRSHALCARMNAVLPLVVRGCRLAALPRLASLSLQDCTASFQGRAIHATASTASSPGKKGHRKWAWKAVPDSQGGSQASTCVMTPLQERSAVPSDQWEADSSSAR